MKLPKPPLLTAKHIEERFKLLAGGLQALALALLGGVVIAPLLNASITAPLWARAVTFTFCGAAEIAAPHPAPLHFNREQSEGPDATMTGNIVLDFVIAFAFAGLGGAITYGGWRLLIREPSGPARKH